MTQSPSPLAPSAFPHLPDIAGVRVATAAAGVHYRDRQDVMLVELAPGTEIAGVFTKSSTRAAPVLDCQEKLGGPSDAGAAILVNAGNANAFTGGHGISSVETLVGAVATETGLPLARIFTASTGVIGERLPHERITGKIKDLVNDLAPGNLQAGAGAIMTTDTFAKGATQRVEIGGKPVLINGIAKGSGMIAPDMATMLVYIFTDAQISQAALQTLTSRICDKTFNRITVDSDTSTSDTLLVAATGQSGTKVETADPNDQAAFETALHTVMLDLAHQVVRDGEGASKFVSVHVTGADSDDDAARVGFAIANSPLVKTAIAGEDPNWGRVVMAVGKSGAKADRDLLSIWFGDVLVAEKGWVSEGYTEKAGAAYMCGEEIEITVDLGVGSAKTTVWTCDLTKRYIEINADYRS